MFKRLLVPLDGSGFGSRALRYADTIAKQFGAEVILLQVVIQARPLTTEGGVDLAMQIALEEDKRNFARARRYLSTKVRGIKSHGIEAEYKVVIGEPAESIMQFSQKEHVDLVIMTTHGKSGLKRAILGSVADSVIRESGKPVLVIHPKKVIQKHEG
jgi:nucleotide-binding universal stress UspA family protein